MILLMGIQGSGKGTQGKMLADQHNYHLISMGDVLRMYATPAQRDRMLAGNLLEDEEIIEIIDSVLRPIPDDEECILDGFPRTIPQAQWLLAQVETGRFQISNVLHLVASRDAVMARLLNRGRVDDKPEAIAARINEYERATQPLLTWFEDHHLPVHNVNAERSVDEVNKDLVNIIKQK